MTEENEKLIIEYERNSFRKLKNQENLNKDIKLNRDILFTSDFIFEEYPSDGDSGKLYLATCKYNENERYIVKHEYYDCCCNEFMYSKLGNKMGIKIAPVKLFIVDDRDDLFLSDFVCGVKYYENAKPVSFSKIENEVINNYEDYYKMCSLEYLFEEADGIEIIEHDNLIYRIDTTAAFTISDFFIHELAYDYNKNGIDIRKTATNNILHQATGNKEHRFSLWKIGYEDFVKEYGVEKSNYFLEPFEFIQKIKKQDIKNWTSTLTIIYPDVIGEYFEIYIEDLKKDAKTFLEEVKKQELVTT